MSWLRRILFRFQPLWSRQRIETELSEELRIHLEMATAANVAAGMSPEAAQRAAQLELGGIEQVKEAWRDQRGLPWLEHLAQDTNHGVRQLRKHPGFTAVITLSLALAIGASTAIFSITHKFLLHPLPLERPEELVHLSWLPGPEGGTPRNYSQTGDVAPFSLPAFERLREAAADRAEVFAYAIARGPNVRVNGRHEVAGAAFAVSGNYFRALGISASHGRVLGAEDDRLDAMPTVVLSHRFWQARFGGDPGAIGRTMEINKVPVTIIGVMPDGFTGPLLAVPADLTVPLAMAPLLVPDGRYSVAPDNWGLRLAGRLRPGTTMEQLRASLAGPFQASARGTWTKPNDFPRLRVMPAGMGRSEAERHDLAGRVMPRAVMAGLLLVAACANVAHLLLARAATRRREMEIRLALGATRPRLFGQLLVESLLLSALGTGLGVVFAFWGTDLLWFGHGEHFGLSGRALAFAIALGLVTGLGFGVAPAARAIGTRGGPALIARSTGAQIRPPLSQALMTAQVAISFVLVVGGALFARSLYNLRHVDIGFDRSHLTVFSVDGLSTGHAGPDLAPLYSQIAGRIAALPGVRAVTFSRMPLLSGIANGRATVALAPGSPAPNEEGAVHNQVDPAFFATYGIPLILGRGFDERDAGAPVTVINETFARKYFGDANPLGRRLYRGDSAWEVIGVAGDIKMYSLRLPVAPTFFIPTGPKLYGAAHFAVRTASGATISDAALRRAVESVDPTLPVANIRQQAEEIERNLDSDRVFVRLGSFFGLVALALAAVGLYGLAAYSTQSRTAEFGIRTAMGALPRHLRWMVLRGSLGVGLTGTLLGIAVAAAAAKFLASRLYGLSAMDPFTHAAAGVVLIGTAAVAALQPANRAAKTDPMIALRCE